MSEPLTKSSPKAGFADLLKHNDVLLAIGLVLIIVMMLIPLPAFLLDMLITTNIALAITILLVTIYTQEPLQYSTFPTILLFSTLFRLGLNVSSTRLILLHGEAGQVIHAFGNFVIGGNYVVGILIFVILIVINFIVITSGAGRVSEVAARFTLDAMPGKQLSIDADLNAGLIDEKEAKRRRSQIQKEADFYGTMDGASKFVKGDAIAAIIITVINIAGGLIIGVIQHGMSLMDSAALYTTLTVGEGLVAQIPALVISAATGVLVTRVSADTETSLGAGIGAQMFKNPKVLGIMGGLLMLMGAIPGLPNIPFLLVGGISAFGSFMLVQKAKQEEIESADASKTQQVQKKKKTSTMDVLEMLPVEPLELEIGYRLVPLIEVDSGGDLLERIAQIRKQTALEYGFVLPSIRVRDNLQLPPTRYNIKLRGITLESGDVESDMWLAMNTDPDGTEPMDGIQTKEPAFGLPALWITTDQKETAEVYGYTVVSSSAVVSTHLTEVVKKYAADILSRQDVQNLLENVKKNNETLVTDIIPEPLTVSELHMILQNLLREKVSIRDMVAILEALSYHVHVNKEIDYLTEQCRMALARNICKQYQSPDNGELPVLTLAPEIEEQLSVGMNPDGKTFAVPPGFSQNFLGALSGEIERAIGQLGMQPVLLCSAKLRQPVRRMIERTFPQVPVMSYNEIGPVVKASAVGMIRLEGAEA